MESKHYKGIYFNDDSEIPQFEFGAHFKYTALYQRLEELKSSLEKNLSDNNLLNTPFNNNYNFEIKKMTNIKYSLSNGFIKDSRNVKNIHKANRTCAMSLIGHNTKKTKKEDTMDPKKIAHKKEQKKKKKEEGLTPEEKVEQAELREEYIEGYRRAVRHHIEGIKIVDEEGNDVTPEKLRQVQREKGLHGRSLDDPNS